MLHTQDLKHLLGQNNLSEVKTALNASVPTAVAEALTTLEPREQVIAYRLLEKDRALEVFELLDPQEQTTLVRALDNPELVGLFEELDPDDRVRLFEELPAKVTKRVLQELSSEARETVTLLMGYPEGSAGRAMTPRYQALRSSTNAAAALTAVQASELRPDELQLLFVIDERRFFKGYLPLAKLVKASADTLVSELVEEANVSVTAKSDRLEAARLLKEHDLPAVAVTDTEGRLVGAMTFDDVIDILEEEASETMYWKAGIGDIAKRRDEVFSQRLIQGPILYPYRVRILFLLITLAGGLAVGGLIDAFEGTLEALIAVAVFIPLIMDMGGNVGTQSTTIFARGLALGHINLQRFIRHLRREGTVGLLMGATLGLAAGTVAYFWQGVPNDVPQLGIAVGISIFTVVLLASLLGFLLPYVLVKVGLDHAPGADPFITTIKDFTGLALYFYLVSALIGVAEEEAEAALALVRLLG
jgi:magnesium transporter